MIVPPRLKIVLFALVWFSCAWFGSWELNPNNSTRLFTAISLIEQHDATVDEFADLTIDKAQFGPHYYLDKAPGMTLWALPAVALGDWLTGQQATPLAKLDGNSDFARYLRLRLRIAVAIGPALLTALAAVLLLDLAAALTGSVGAGLFAALGYALGTPAWGWSTTVLGHAPVAALYVVAIWAVWRGTRGERSRGWCALLVGAALGSAVGIEFQAALAGGVVAAWAALRYWRSPRRWWLLGLATIGGIGALIPIGVYNQIAFGTPFKIGYSGVVGWVGMQRGLFGLGLPSPSALLKITVGPAHGMIWVAPILLLAIPGLAWWWRARAARPVIVVVTAVTLVTLLVNAAYVYWDGGNATGPRLSVPLVGVLSLGLAPAWVALSSRALRIAAGAFLALSIAINLAIASADIFAPPIYAFPLWTDVIAGRFARGELQTIGSDWWGWYTWSGLWAWALVALPTFSWLVRTAAAAYPALDRVTGASGSPQGSAA